MKYATKMMVVPFVKPLETPIESKLQQLDNDMSLILADKNLNFDEKIKLYNTTLSKFMTIINPEGFGQTTVLNKVEPQEKIIKGYNINSLKKAINRRKKYIKKETKIEPKEELEPEPSKQPEPKKTTIKSKVSQDLKTVSQNEILPTKTRGTKTEVPLKASGLWASANYFS